MRRSREIEQAARGGGRCEMRGISCVPDVKPRPPGAECVLRPGNGLENGKRLSGINRERHSKALRAGRVKPHAS